MRNKKGFTLIEMLVVIAIIAVLVSIIIPTVSSASDKAKAATDAANLRSVLGYMNSVLMTEEMDIEEATSSYSNTPESKLHPGADLYVLYTLPGVIDVYYKDAAGNCYGLKYLSDIAENGKTDLEAVVTTPFEQYTWYPVGTAG